MKDEDIAAALAEFGVAIRKEVTGLSQSIVWILYGDTHDYQLGGLDGKDWSAAPLKQPKSRVDWETLVLAEGGGALQGHNTGVPERKVGGGFSGRFEEKKNIQFIHQLLPANFMTLKTKCELQIPALNDRAGLLAAEPCRASAIFFFQEYLRSIYRSVIGADEESLRQGLKSLPGGMDVKTLIARWKEIEQRFRTEKKGTRFEVKEGGRLFVYTRVGNDKKLINGWIYGLSGAEEGKGKPAAAVDAGPDGEYEQRLAEGAFCTRTKALLMETQRLLGEGAVELIALAGRRKEGRLEKTVRNIESWTIRHAALDATQRETARQQTERFARELRAVLPRPRLLRQLELDETQVKAWLAGADKLVALLGDKEEPAEPPPA